MDADETREDIVVSDDSAALYVESSLKGRGQEGMYGIQDRERDEVLKEVRHRPKKSSNGDKECGHLGRISCIRAPRREKLM